MKKSWHLPRRTLLRGAGAAMGLPLLEAMSPTTARAARAATRPPIRTAVLFYPNGVRPETWNPTGSGSDYQLSPALKPLAPFKNDMLVLNGLRHSRGRKGDGHFAKTASFLTGLQITKTTGKDLNAGGISLDQLMAKEVGQFTLLPSLELGIDPVSRGVDTNVGFTRVYGGHISWGSPTTPIAKEIIPQLAFDRLFRTRRKRPVTTGGPQRDVQLFKPMAEEEPEITDDQSILDLVLEDAQGLRKQVGKSDQRKLDEYLTAVRSIEKQITAANSPDERQWRPKSVPKNLKRPGPGRPRSHEAHVQMMLDLMVLAFWTDTTRISTFMFGNSQSGKNFSFVDGVGGGHHQISHHENKKDKLEMYTRINTWHCQQLAYMMDRMKKIDEGDGTLLSNSMVLFGSGIRDGNRHDGGNMPLILAGQGGGSIKTGRYLSYKGKPAANLFLSMAQRMGVKADKFADSKGPLAGLL